MLRDLSLIHILQNRQQQGRDGVWLDLPTTTEQVQAALRQIGISSDNPQGLFISGYFAEEEKRFAIPYNMVLASNAVSYTHLDVYKRQDMAIVRREISSSISYTASFLGTICLEVPSPIPTVFFLHLTVALQRRTVYDFLIGGHLLPDRELREREYLMFLGRCV